MEEFRHMVDQLLASRLGPVKYRSFFNYVLETADVNKDSKVQHCSNLYACLQCSYSLL